MVNTCREHVGQPLHAVFGAVSVQVPVEHPLAVPQAVSGPHHAAAHALQYHARPRGGAHVVAGHHHTAAAVALARN